MKYDGTKDVADFNKGSTSDYYPPSTDKSRDYLAKHLAQWIEWFSGKRYGIILEDDLGDLCMNAEIDLSGLPIEPAYSPMVIKWKGRECFFWNSQEGLLCTSIEEVNGESACQWRHAPIKVADDKLALRLWLASVASVADSGDTCEIKAGSVMIGLMPKANCLSLLRNNKIAEEAEGDRGSWIRRGHFRNTRNGPIWIPGAHYRRDEPFVLKVHEVKRKQEFTVVP